MESGHPRPQGEVMKTDYQYIRFVQVPTERRLTSIWSCQNIRHGEELGRVQWNGAWRQYCFDNTCLATWSLGCLADIQDFIGQLMRERSQSKVE